MASRAIVLCASDMLARAYRSVGPDRRAPNGDPINAAFGATRALRRILSFKPPHAAVAVVDATPDPAPWYAQRAPWHAVLQDHHVPVVPSHTPFDTVADYVRGAVQDGFDVVLGGSDKRLGQLVADEVWWYEGHKDVRYTPEAIRKRFGVGPRQLADWLALVGLEDVLEGVPRIGAKGAVELLDSFDSLEAALAELDSIPGRLGKALRAAPEHARRQLQKARLGSAAPLAPGWADLSWQPPPTGPLNDRYRALGFTRMLVREEATTLDVTVAHSAEEVRAWLGSNPANIAMQVVTEAPSPVRGDLVGVALARHQGPPLYVPGHLVQSLADWATDPERPKVGHGTKAAQVALGRLGIPLRGLVGDVAVASFLLDPAGLAPHRLEGLARSQLGVVLEPAEGLLGKGKSMRAWCDVEPAAVAAWAAPRAGCALALWDGWRERVPAAQLRESLALDQVLVRMDLAGMPCQASALASVGRDFEAMEASLEREIHELAGKSFSITSNPQLGAVLFEDLGLPVLRKTKTGWSVANEVLERLRDAHPIVPRVIHFKLLRRMRDTWVKALAGHISKNGRVHSTVHGARSFSGRLITTTPDLGRTPTRTVELNRIRQAFVAPHGHQLLSVDYEQLGLYVLAHLTEDPALVEPLASGADLHRATAAALLDKPAETLTASERQLGKVVNFATFAGQGASALAQQLGVEPKEAKRLIARFYDRYAGVAAFQAAQLAHAREHGFVETLAGRRWWIGNLESREQRDRAYAERMARRAAHEGSVADITRRGLLRADEALRTEGVPAQPLVQILDEIVFEVPAEHVARAAAVAGAAMCTAFDMRVPLRVSAKAGPTWGDLRLL